MNLNISINQMRYLVSLADEKNFVKAAEKCFISQPALTMQIQQIEEILNVNIVDRSKKPLVITDIGQKIIAQCRLIIQETQKVEDIISDYRKTAAEHLKLGVIPTIAPYLSPRFIPRILDDFTESQISVKEELTDPILDALLRGELDAGIIVIPYQRAEQFRTIPLYYERFYAFVSPQHPFFNTQKINLHNLSSDDLWLLSEGNCFRNQVLNVCHGTPSPKGSRFHYVSTSIEALKKIVLLEGGMTILPELAITEEDQKEGLVRSFYPESPVRQVTMIVTRTFLKQSFIESIIELIKSSVPNELLQPRGDLVNVDLITNG